MWKAIASIADAVVAVVQAIAGTGKSTPKELTEAEAQSMRHGQASGASSRDAGLRAQGGGRK